MNKVILFSLCMTTFSAACSSGMADEAHRADGIRGTEFWRDVAPIYMEKCVRCHQTGGIAPFALDTYSDAKAHGPAAVAQVLAGKMPPYFMVHDDSCGDFDDSMTLSEREKSTIKDWVDAGMAEGPRTTLQLPEVDRLEDTTDLHLPEFAPVAAGSGLAEFDEYRCFLIEPPSGEAFITGYEVSPGDPSIVHHAIMFIVDPAAKGTEGAGENRAVIQALDDASPDRSGWPCFATAGDGIRVKGTPVAWAPGQGVVRYPTGTGVQLRDTDRLVVQIHYNLAEPDSVGKSDRTTIHLRLATTVERPIAFALPDPFLGSLENPVPDFLEPGRKSVTYRWTRSGEQIGIAGLPYMDLLAVNPHMHGRGTNQSLRLRHEGNWECGYKLENWDIHWQRMYFYNTPIRVSSETDFELTCEYDTSQDTAPVFPGWGSRNEMCLSMLMLAAPRP